MSFKQRLNAAEKKAGIGSNVDIAVFRTIYNDQNGNVEKETAYAAISSRTNSITVSSNDGEDFNSFEKRIERECMSEFGNLPPDWKAGAG
jgi:hypothetical protein